MTPLARAAVCLVLLTLLAGCRTTINPMAISDAQTAARVKTALVNDPDLGSRIIEVRVVLGAVRLTGRVSTPEEAARAAAIARGVSGVVSVQASLLVGVEEAVPDEQLERPGVPAVDLLPELQDNPGFLALGASLGWSVPRAAELGHRIALGPLVKIGSGQGLGLAVGLGWVQAKLRSLSDRPDALTHVQLKPIMLGAGYTVGTERTSLSASLVGGYAWNSLTVTKAGAANGLPVEVDNSFVWRPGVSLWHNVSRRTALNVSVGHVMTRLRLTVLEDGQLEKRSMRGDTTVVSAGMVYRLF
jgi:hypothetical protein